jgi:integrase-like protein
MTARLEETRTAATPAPVQLFRETRQAAWAAARGAFPPRLVVSDWPATHADLELVLGLLSRAPFAVAAPGSQRWRFRGARLAITWLADQPGGTWQQRWLASRAETAGPGWKQNCAQWLDAQGMRVQQRLDLLSVGMILMISADIIRPSLGWLAASGVSPWALARTLEHGRDPAGFARLRAAVGSAGQITAGARHATIGRAAVIIAAKGGMLADVTAGDFLELLDAEREDRSRPGDYSAISWRLLRRCGAFGPHPPASLAQLLTIGQRSPAELIDRYQLTCRPVRDLLVDYLQERQPALDHRSLDTLAQQLARNFWADLEYHHPGISSLNLPPEIATAWKQRLRTKTAAPRRSNTGPQAPRLTCRHTLLAVRAFYLDLACWATEGPARWGPWAAPSPVSKADVNSRKEDRRRKSRMDARTRERLPVLPVLVRSAAEHHARTGEALAAASQAPPGGTFTAGGDTFTRAAARKPGIRIWAEDSRGKRHDLTWEEDHAFWTWAIIEVLRATGVRAEELLELTHHSLVQYRLPTTGELVPLLQIAPSKTDAERLLVVSPELADVLSAIITRLQQPAGKIPLTGRYDGHEHIWQPPAPLLFQRHGGTETRQISTGTVRNMLNAALARAGLTDAAGQPLTFTPHDFRRMFITEAILAGLPPHIAQVIAGHRDINVTLGYKAVYPDEVIKNHLGFLARRRAQRPTEEYRTPTDEEWEQFLGHFERRKVSAGLCGRAFATPCIHEHACIRCPMLWPGAAQRPRIAEIRDNLIARISEAEREGWPGEIEGLKISLAGANDKLTQIDRRARRQPVDLGIPGLPASPQPRHPVQA